MFRLNISDTQKALIMAVIIGALTPVSLILQSPGFDIFHAQWLQLLDLAATGAVVGFMGYLMKNFLSDSNGKLFGKIG